MSQSALTDAQFREFLDDVAAVVAGSAISFVTNLTQQMRNLIAVLTVLVFREDVVNSIFLAPLASHKMFDPMTQGQQWYSYYLTVLQSLGWDAVSFKTCRPKALWMLAYLAGILSGPQVDLFRQTIGAIQNDERATNLSNQSTAETSVADFQIGFCDTKWSSIPNAGHQRMELDQALFWPFWIEVFELFRLKRGIPRSSCAGISPEKEI
ncbi:hypothetical protein C8R43DRAFT_948371 [Mycena crocata]|nr:hypothetical protein C8R43DRAFT_948371 [Mycena crocata]